MDLSESGRHGARAGEVGGLAVWLKECGWLVGVERYAAGWWLGIAGRLGRCVAMVIGRWRGGGGVGGGVSEPVGPARAPLAERGGSRSGGMFQDGGGPRCRLSVIR